MNMNIFLYINGGDKYTWYLISTQESNYAVQSFKMLISKKYINKQRYLQYNTSLMIAFSVDGKLFAWSVVKGEKINIWCEDIIGMW
jgi:hypothetical protein